MRTRCTTHGNQLTRTTGDGPRTTDHGPWTTHFKSFLLSDLAANVRICVCWLHHPNDRHFSLSPTCRKCQPDTSATFCYISHFFCCRCCVGELYPRHTFLCVGRKWYYTFLGMCHVSHACKKQVFVAKNILQGAQNDFLFQRTFCEEHTTYKMFSGLVVFHSFARSTHHKQLLSCLVVFHALAVYHSKGDDWVHCLRDFH